MECGGSTPLWMFGVRRLDAALDVWSAAARRRFGCLDVCERHSKKTSKAASSRRTPKSNHDNDYLSCRRNMLSGVQGREYARATVPALQGGFVAAVSIGATARRFVRGGPQRSAPRPLRGRSDECAAGAPVTVRRRNRALIGDDSTPAIRFSLGLAALSTVDFTLNNPVAEVARLWGSGATRSLATSATGFLRRRFHIHLRFIRFEPRRCCACSRVQACVHALSFGQIDSFMCQIEFQARLLAQLQR